MRGSLDWSEAERRVALRLGDQAESEGKRPSGQPVPERDNATSTQGHGVNPSSSGGLAATPGRASGQRARDRP